MNSKMCDSQMTMRQGNSFTAMAYKGLFKEAENKRDGDNMEE